jgi:hypothetical protein
MDILLVIAAFSSIEDFEIQKTSMHYILVPHVSDGLFRLNDGIFPQFC